MSFIVFSILGIIDEDPISKTPDSSMETILNNSLVVAPRIRMLGRITKRRITKIVIELDNDGLQFFYSANYKMAKRVSKR